MSCHDIGRGMNDITRKVISLYDNNRIGKDVAKELILECANAVNWCDGNANEAIDYIRHNRCGECLRKIPMGKPLYSLWRINYNYSLNDIFGSRDLQEEAGTASDIICEDCIRNVLSKLDLEGRNLEDIVKQAKIDEVSSGEPPKYNNGCSW